MLERQSITSKEKIDSSVGIQKQFENILARLGDLENVNLRLKENEKAALLECRKLEDRVKAAEDSKKLAEEKEIALIRENGRLRERIDGIEIENRRLQDELARAKRGSISMEARNSIDFKPVSKDVDRGIEERRKLLDENEQLVNMITQLRREKAALETKIKRDDETSEEGRARLITFGQSMNVLTPKGQDDDTIIKDLEIQEQDKRSQRTKRLLNSAAPSSVQGSASNIPETKIENYSPLQRQQSLSNQLDNSPKLRGQIFPKTDSKEIEKGEVSINKQEYKHTRNNSMMNLTLKESLMDKPAPIAVVRMSEQNDAGLLNSQLQSNMGLFNGMKTVVPILGPYIDVNRMIARNRPNEDPSLVNVQSFDIKERR